MPPDPSPTDAAAPPETGFDFDAYIPFLVRRILPYLDDLAAAEMEVLGLNPEALDIMLALRRRGPQSLSSLAELTCINISTLSRLIGRMQKQQLVQRRPCGYGRTVEISLLPLGERKIEAMIPAMRELQATMARVLTPDELETTRTALRQLYKVIVRIATDQGDHVTRVRVKRFRAPDAS